MQAQAILFDCDGVLVDSEIVGLTEVVAFLRGHGFDWSEEDLIRRFTGMRSDRFRDGMAVAYREVLGRVPSDDEVATLFQGIISTRREQRHQMTLVTGAEAMLTVAAELDGIRRAVASSSAQDTLNDKIDRFGLRPYFQRHVYSADVVAHGKPEPDIFLHAASAVGVAPEHCIVIEDSAHGVAAGVAAGAMVWGFTGGGHCLAGHGEALSRAGAAQVFQDHHTLSQALADIRP